MKKESVYITDKICSKHNINLTNHIKSIWLSHQNGTKFRLNWNDSYILKINFVKDIFNKYVNHKERYGRGSIITEKLCKSGF